VEGAGIPSNCEAETVKKIRNFRLKAKHKVPYKKTCIILLRPKGAL